jgi:hypothetical protein
MLLVGFLLINLGFALFSFNNPTTTYEKQITVSERQILSSILIRNYYIVTPDNTWYECNEFNNTWDQLQPGHTYNVQIRKSAPRSWMYNQEMSDDELNLTKQLDESTNIYNNEMIVGVDGEIT